jgi:Uma2 family endonuclease
MRTLLPDPPPAELEALLARRRKLGLDRHDEVWEGVLHIVPAPRNAHTDIQQQLAELIGPLARRSGLHPLIAGEVNIGDCKDDFRVPDGALLRKREDAIWNPTAALAIEILSCDDEAWEKLPFYAAHHVAELLIVDPAEHEVHWLALTGESSYEPIERSRLIDLGPASLAAQIDWP